MKTFLPLRATGAPLLLALAAPFLLAPATPVTAQVSYERILDAASDPAAG